VNQSRVISKHRQGGRRGRLVVFHLGPARSSTPHLNGVPLFPDEFAAGRFQIVHRQGIALVSGLGGCPRQQPPRSPFQSSRRCRIRRRIKRRHGISFQPGNPLRQPPWLRRQNGRSRVRLPGRFKSLRPVR
jgi:hypothetical protein